jgi:hypothetical protein
LNPNVSRLGKLAMPAVLSTALLKTGSRLLPEA